MNKLPPLPKPRWSDGGWNPPSDDAFDADQMRAYGKTCAAAAVAVGSQVERGVGRRVEN